MLHAHANGAGSQLRGRRARHWRQDGAILARLEEVDRLHLNGWSNRAIARHLKVNEWTIRVDIGRLQELWLERAGETVLRLRAECVRRLDAIYWQAMRDAEHDRQYERWVLFGIPPDDMDPATVPPRDGRVTFKSDKAHNLDIARQAIMDMAKLLGLARPPQPDQDGQRMTLADLMRAHRESQARECQAHAEEAG